MAFDVEKTWETKAGYQAVCIVIKDMHRCGYVGVPKKHSLHGIEYNEATESLSAAWKEILDGKDEGDNKRGPIITLLACCYGDSPKNWSPDRIVNVHGGLTYSGGKDYPVENKDGLWWFGFDCGHSGDGTLNPNPMFDRHSPVRSEDYVITECESMATQLKALE
jgi:hypothetical protein